MKTILGFTEEQIKETITGHDGELTTPPGTVTKSQLGAAKRALKSHGTIEALEAAGMHRTVEVLRLAACFKYVIEGI